MLSTPEVTMGPPAHGIQRRSLRLLVWLRLRPFTRSHHMAAAGGSTGPFGISFLRAPRRTSARNLENSALCVVMVVGIGCTGFARQLRYLCASSFEMRQNCSVAFPRRPL